MKVLEVSPPLNNDLRTGRPEVSNRAELVEKVREIIGIDANFTTRMLAEELNTSKNTIWRMLTENLGRRKVSARFVPHELNEDQKSLVWSIAKSLLKLLKMIQSFLI